MPNNPATQRRQRIMDLLAQGEMTTRQITDQIRTTTVHKDLHLLLADGEIYRRRDPSSEWGTQYLWGKPDEAQMRTWLRDNVRILL